MVRSTISLRLGDNDGLALAAAKPVALPTVIPFDIRRRGFTLHQFVLWDDRCIGGPLVRAGHGDVPLRKALDHLLQCLLIPSSTFPVQELPGVPIENLPDPEFVPLFLQVVPHRIALQDDRAPRGLRLLVIGGGQVPDPGEYGLGGDAEEACDPVHRHATEIPQHGVDFYRAGSYG